MHLRALYVGIPVLVILICILPSGARATFVDLVVGTAAGVDDTVSPTGVTTEATDFTATITNTSVNPTIGSFYNFMQRADATTGGSSGTCEFGSSIGGGLCRGFLTSGTSWTVPSDWSSTSNTIECIGAGGNGSAGVNANRSGNGGGGGAYAKITNLAISAGATISYGIGLNVSSAGSMANETYFNSTASTTAPLSCAYGKVGLSTGVATSTGGSTANSTGTLTYAGGDGGKGASNASGRGGAGGGGSAGPTGAGKNGGNNNAAASSAAGGGGSNGGSSTVGTSVVSGSSNIGYAGGKGTGGTGGGAQVAADTAGNSGTASSGGGGSGGGGFASGTPGIGGNGAIDTAFDATHGAGGGGGGGGRHTTGVARAGGAGGTYGGGGGGGGSSTSGTSGAGGLGGQGIIAITYTAQWPLNVVDLPAVQMAVLPGSSSQTATFNYAFSSGDVGTTRYLRVCADKSSAGDAGTMSETNEGNNCGTWTPITVSSEIPPTPGGSPDLITGAISSTPAPTLGAVTFFSDIANLNNALSFDGASGKVRVPSSSSLESTPNSEISVCAWTYVPTSVGNQANYAHIAGKDWSTPRANPWTTYELIASNVANQHYAFVTTLGGAGAGNNVLDSGVAITKGAWTHICGTMNSPSKKIYVNGILRNSNSNGVAMQYNSGDFTIGANSDSQEWFNGYIDDVRVYNKALTAGEVAQVYAGAVLSGNLVARWPFNEGSGLSTADTSGNGNTGTLTNSGVTWVLGTAGASTGSTPFTNIFQIDNDAAHNTSFATSTSASITDLAGGDTVVTNASYTFAAPGIYYIRACGDENSSMVGVIDEANENNNCGDWEQITVPTPPPTCSQFTISPAEALLGSPVTVSWSCENANPNSCAELSNTTDFQTGGAVSGTDEATPTAVGTFQYGIHCSGPGGEADILSEPFDVVEATAKITASPPRINFGGSVTITASCDQVTEGRVEGPSSTCSDPTPADASNHFSCTFPSVNILSPVRYYVFCTRASDSVEIESSATIQFRVRFLDY